MLQHLVSNQKKQTKFQIKKMLPLRPSPPPFTCIKAEQPRLLFCSFSHFCVFFWDCKLPRKWWWHWIWTCGSCSYLLKVSIYYSNTTFLGRNPGKLSSSPLYIVLPKPLMLNNKLALPVSTTLFTYKNKSLGCVNPVKLT